MPPKRWFAPCAWRRLLAACVASIPLVAAAAPEVSKVRIRFADAATTGTPSPDQAARIGQAIRSGIAGSVATRDGGYELTLSPPLSFEAARAGVNRLRLDPGVLYASVGGADSPRAPVAPATTGGPEPLLSRIIVKYRDPAAAADAVQDRAPSRARLDALAVAAGQPVAYERSIAWAGAQLVTLMAKQPRADIEAIARAIEADPDVDWAEPDYIRQINLVPNDPSYASQWHYFAPASAAGGANLPGAWDITRGWSGIRIAVLDTGALFAHPDLGPRFIGGYDFVADYIFGNDGFPAQPPTCLPTSDPRFLPCISSRDADASDPGDWITAAENNGTQWGGWLQGCPIRNSSWHGSHVAGTIGALTNNNTGVAGVNWVGRIVPARVLGKCGGYDTDIADAMTWTTGGTVSGVPANAHVARVINLSLGGGSPSCPSLYQNAINGALARGSVVVVSAGNGNTEASGSTPANCAGVVTVAAIGRTGQRASYSNYDINNGSGIQVEIAAPGGSFADGQAGVLSTLNSGTTSPNAAGYNYVEYQGTSMAAPHVAGIASLMLSVKPSLTPAQVLSIMQTTARAFPTGTVRDCTSNLAAATAGSVAKYCGTGIVDAAAAVNQIMATGGIGGTALTPATAALTTSASPAAAGTTVTFTTTVTGNIPSGPVQFYINEFLVCDAVPLNGAGQAQCATSALPAGTHFVRAVYGGNTSNTPADSNGLSQVITSSGPGPTTTTVAGSPNPASQGANVSLVATVTGTSPTGSVEFRTNGVVIFGCNAVAVVGAGNARTATCATNGLAPGTNTILATYGGDAFNLGSSGSASQAIIGATACFPFNDIAAASPFCANVQWMFNRQITQGCGPIDFCGGSPVTRLAMAAFMNREGSALTGEDLPIVSDDAAATLPAISCVTAAYPVSGYPRRAYVRGPVNVYAPTGNLDALIELVYSSNGGATWTPIPGASGYASLYAGRSPVDDRTLTPSGAVDLAVGSTYLFGARVTRIAGSGNVGLYCATHVRVRNRNATVAPF